MTNQQARRNAKANLETRDSYAAASRDGAAARGELALTPAQQAAELVAQIEIAKLHGDRAKWQAARAELLAIIELL